ncbi:MAG: hypothetical protein K9N51_09030 [Candidatus Pacebacteria bacterium]|nr:hypothetical protein [Candidatus Paceibacterota bacterium]
MTRKIVLTTFFTAIVAVTPLRADRVALLSYDDIWAKGGAAPVYEQDFSEGGPAARPAVRIYKGESNAPTYNDRLANGGYDGSDCWMIEAELPAGRWTKIRFPLPETEADGIHYRFLLKIESQPEFGPTDLALAINEGSHPFAHSVYRLEPLEHDVVKSGPWMTTIWPIWKGHKNEVHHGWTRVTGDTSTYVLRGEKWAMFEGITVMLINRTKQARRVKLFCDDIEVVRRPVGTSPEMRALMESPRPVIGYTRKQILNARAYAAEKGDDAVPGWVKKKLKSADAWLTRDITVPRMQAGYPTKYRCKECNAVLRPNPPTGYLCPKCGKEHTGELYDKLLAYERHKALGEAVHALGFAWQWTDDERYARRAEAILLGYADAIGDFRLGHNWLGTCWLMENTLRGYDYIYEWLSQASRETIDNDFLNVIRRRIYHYNHHYPEGYSRLLEICGWISVLTKDVNWSNYLFFSPVGNHRVLLRYGLTEDMISLKGAAYHGDIVRALNRVGKTLENCGIRFFDARVKPVYDVVFKQIFPDRSLPAFGHSNVGYPASIYDFDTAYRFYRDERYLKFCSKRFLQEAPSFFDIEPPTAPEDLYLRSSHLEALGLTMLRSQPDNDSVLALSWGAPQRNDPTRLDFQLYGAGGHLIWSSGTTDYGNPLMNSWYQQSISRNMMVVDEGTQKPLAGKCLFLDTENPVQIVAAELRDAFPDTRIVRVGILLDSGDVALVDLFSSPRPRTVDWVCHVPGDIMSPLEFSAVDESPFGDENGYEILTNITRANTASPIVLNLRHQDKRGDRGVRITTASGDNTIPFLGQGFTGHSNKPSQVCILRRREVTQTVYATLFQPHQGESEPEAGNVAIETFEIAQDTMHVHALTVTLTVADGTHVITIRETPMEGDDYAMDVNVTTTRKGDR